ncbi:hypothetical protein IGI01_26000 [Bacillus thuringiensis]|nr:hypothetical protein [Bacillus thuringiensis]
MRHNGDCAPTAQVIQEIICGNINGPLTDAEVWSAPPGTYFSGTFELFNSAASLTNITAKGISSPAIDLSVIPGNTRSQSANQPTGFTVTVAAGDSGSYCIILYK